MGQFTEDTEHVRVGLSLSNSRQGKSVVDLLNEAETNELT